MLLLTVLAHCAVDTAELNSVAPKPSVSEIISQKFSAFDHQGTIIEPFENESKRDVEFQESECMRSCMHAIACLHSFEELSNMLIELMLEFHAWSIARPVHESEATAEALEKEIHDIIETETEQGRSSISLPPPQTIVGRQCSTLPLVLPAHNHCTCLY